jgi:hypothetical protein
VICDFVDAPHQRFLFIYDLNVQWSFLIELMKIGQPEPKKSYPLCVKTFGIAPKQYKIVHMPTHTDDDDETVVKSKRGRKPVAKKDPAPVIMDDDDIEEDDVEIEEEVTYVEQEEIEVGYTEDEEEKSSDSEDEDEFDASFGDGEEESFGSYNDQSEDY